LNQYLTPQQSEDLLYQSESSKWMRRKHEQQLVMVALIQEKDSDRH
jgi:hypothetical protein